MPAPQIILDLIERFERNKEAYKSGAYNETQVRREFIDPFFQALGWDVNNEAGNAEAYKDVIHEDAVKVGGVTKAPDYSFRIGGQRKFFVEAKQPSINIKDTPAPAYQVRRYAWSAKLPLSIVTDFDEFAVYDCRVKPDQSDRADKARILYYTYKQYDEKWDEIAGIFSKDAILKGSFDKYAEFNKGKRGTAEVDSAFLAEIESWREMLARNIALRNTLSVRELNDAVQRTIDRIIFLRIAEDRGIEEYGSLRGLCNGNNAYARLRELFYKADDRYNSGLFHFRHEKNEAEPPDNLTTSLTIDDKPLKDILKRLYYPDSPYEFSVLPADILGQVYEQFLGKVIRLTSDHRATVEDKPEVKKAGGVFYTPTYIVEYIVQNTVGKLLEGKTPRTAEKLRILDPACGSGSFLLGAYQHLLDWHVKWYAENDPEKYARAKKPVLFKGQGGAWHLTTAERKRILLNNIYGVDIDFQACEVTKLSLLLKVLEGETGETLNYQFKLFHERALPNLGGNIKCGNSLIGPDFYEGKQTSLLDTEEMQRVNAFDWQAEFPDIFKAGGFDAVIGNPPYIHQREEIISRTEIEYFKSKYIFSTFRQNTFALFIEKAFMALRQCGMFSFIVPNYFLSTDNDAALRKFLFENNKAKIILNVKDVFISATVFCAILVNEKGGISNNIDFYERTTDKPTLIGNISGPKCFKPSRDNGYKLLFKASDKTHSELGLYFQTFMGIVPYRKGYGEPAQTEKIISEKVYNLIEPQASNDYPYYTAADCGFFYLKDNIRYIRYGRNLAESRDLSVFSGWRIVVQRIIALKPVRLKTNIFYDIAICNSDLITIKPKEPINEKYIFMLAGILSSKYFGYLLADCNINLKRTVYPKINMKTLLSMPIPRLDEVNEDECKKMNFLVESMITVQKQRAEAKTGHEQTLLQRRIDATDKQIDKLVYELYGLTEDEIKIVEGR